MFKSLTKINSAFRCTRIVAIVAILASALFAIYVTYSSNKMVERQREKVYVLDNGRSLLLALQQDLTTNRPVELRHHIEMLHELLFNLTPDVSGINSNMKRAFELGDKSIYESYTDLKEAGYYRRIISNNIIQQTILDSINCNFDYYPYNVTTYGRQIIDRESNRTIRALTTTCTVVNVNRTDNNPHGFLVKNFVVTNNETISSEKK
jgi:conjugative transposon TraK protein